MNADKSYNVQSIAIGVSPEQAIRYIADPANLPKWTKAFQSVNGGRAVMATPAGSVEVELRVDASAETGVIDWTMVFPDNTRARAFSRVIGATVDWSLYIFALTAPPTALENLEGALSQQEHTLREELVLLKTILERESAK
ncbi:MAG TPA: hypothetical protein VER03_00840 [Bryobacteraceae bacterium]|nr:hypothetical protein [Bryobacteraceae bacterium]